MNLPVGYRYAATYAGIRAFTKDDLALIVSAVPANAARAAATGDANIQAGSAHRSTSRVRSVCLYSRQLRDHPNQAMSTNTSNLNEINDIVSDDKSFILSVVQPGLAGLMDGSVSTLAPLFAAAFATHNTWQTFLVGIAASVGAGISMAFAEGLSDDGSLTGRGSPWIRGPVCGLMTAVGGLGHTLPYLIPHFATATIFAVIVVVIELVVISWIRMRYMDTPFLRAAFQVVVGGALVFIAGILIGSS